MRLLIRLTDALTDKAYLSIFNALTHPFINAAYLAALC